MANSSASRMLSPMSTLRIRRRQALSALTSSQQTINLARLHEAACAEAVSLAQSAAQHVQKSAHQKIASLVTECFSAVFGADAYEFRIEFECKRNKTEARLVFVREGHEIDPLTASGGGVVDVAAFALRLSCLLLSQPPLRRLLVLDEPWKHLSAKYRPAMRELVEALSERLNVQFLIVTHAESFQIGKVITITRSPGSA